MEEPVMDPQPKQTLDLPSRVTVFPSQDRAIDQILEELLVRCPAEYILVAEVSGQVFSVKGKRDVANPVVLASLVAGDMAASQEIARVTGQYQHFQFSLREGAAANTFIAEAGGHLVLFVQVAKDVPLGWARMLIAEASHRLEAIMASTPDDIPDVSVDLGKEGLTNWLDDALGSLWNK
jgi:predicted regulator of Ras-like GTPase activity (Roadblock/LC7/MglB family)